MSEASRHHEVPIVGVTAGDAGGIGLECLLKALAQSQIYDRVGVVLFSARRHLEKQAEYLDGDARDLATAAAWTPFAGRPDRPGLFLHPLEEANTPIEMGRYEPLWGAVSCDAIERAIKLAKDRQIDAVVTLPICKKALLSTTPPCPGQTELFAARTNSTRYAMMLAGPSLRVVPVTVHIPLRDVPKQLNEDLITERIILTGEALQQEFGIDSPTIAVCGLNPHAGESGLLGDEESRMISPAIERARKSGFDVHGPFPADGLFARAHRDEIDAVVCMYHDQGLVPLKLLHFDEAVNMTLGIPLIRTSPDHGVAYDIAGNNRAHPGSTLSAIALALDRLERKQSRF